MRNGERLGCPQPFWEAAMETTVAWYRDNPDWWEPIKTGSYRAYYDEHYANRLKA